ncbi:MAG: hypothetical protein WDN25_13380 [Acetobacteraceae bacterium]
MTLYVANCSKQRVDFAYRVPEEIGAPRRQQIERGAQIMVFKRDLGLPAAKAIIAQHERYGIVPLDEIDRCKPFIGLCYSFDKPIPVDAIMRADEHNTGALEIASAESRVATAAALHQMLERSVEGAPTQLDSVEIEVVVQNGPHEPGLNEAVTVTRDQAATEQRREKARQGGGRKPRRR